MLIGGPGIGKGLILHPTFELLAQTPGVHLAPKMTTKEKLIHLMAAQMRSIPGSSGIDFQSAYTAVVPELATLIRPNDIEFVNVLLELFDGKNFRYETLSRETALIENPYLNFIAGTTPTTLNDNAIIGGKSCTASCQRALSGAGA